jgi:hypothetical protein
MNIYTIRDNLKNTIAGKEALLENYKKASLRAHELDTADKVTIAAMAGFLSTNLEELRAILKDVEQCCEQATAKSWEGVDRQGGI